MVLQSANNSYFNSTCIFLIAQAALPSNGSAVFSLSFCIFFVFFAITAGFEIDAALSPPLTQNISLSLAGWVNAIQLLEDRSDYAKITGEKSALNVVPIMFACCASLWTLLAGNTILIFSVTGRAYKIQGYSGKAAREEFQRTTRRKAMNGVPTQSEESNGISDAAPPQSSNRV